MATGDLPCATLTLQPAGLTVAVRPGETLLEAARAAGLRLRSSCRNGTCRACLARLEAGTVHHRVEWPGLSVEEQRAGWVLPCVALPVGDVTLIQPLIDA